MDTDLRRIAGGAYEPKAVDLRVQFSGGGSGPLVRVQTESGASIEESSPFGALPKPVVDGPSATYREVLPGVDLRLEATPSGVAEILVIKSAAAAANPELDAVAFNVKAANLKHESNGSTRATASDGSVINSSAPTWWDSSGAGNVHGPDGNAVPEPVVKTGDANTVKLNVADTIKSRQLEYPIYIDPDWTGGVSAFWYIDQAYPTESYLNGQFAGGEQRVGYITAAYSPQDNKNHLARAFWRMNTSAVAGKQISAAQFSVSETWAFNCTAWPSTSGP